MFWLETLSISSSPWSSGLWEPQIGVYAGNIPLYLVWIRPMKNRVTLVSMIDS